MIRDLKLLIYLWSLRKLRMGPQGQLMVEHAIMDTATKNV